MYQSPFSLSSVNCLLSTYCASSLSCLHRELPISVLIPRRRDFLSASSSSTRCGAAGGGGTFREAPSGGVSVSDVIVAGIGFTGSVFGGGTYSLTLPLSARFTSFALGRRSGFGDRQRCRKSITCSSLAGAGIL